MLSPHVPLTSKSCLPILMATMRCFSHETKVAICFIWFAVRVITLRIPLHREWSAPWRRGTLFAVGPTPRRFLIRVSLFIFISTFIRIPVKIVPPPLHRRSDFLTDRLLPTHPAKINVRYNSEPASRPTVPRDHTIGSQPITEGKSWIPTNQIGGIQKDR